MRRRHPLENKQWKEKLHHLESALDKKLREEVSMEKENERERQRGTWKLKEDREGS